MELVVEQLDLHKSVDPILRSEEFMQKLMLETAITERAAVLMLLRDCFGQLTETVKANSMKSSG